MSRCAEKLSNRERFTDLYVRPGQIQGMSGPSSFLAPCLASQYVTALSFCQFSMNVNGDIGLDEVAQAMNLLLSTPRSLGGFSSSMSSLIRSQRHCSSKAVLLTAICSTTCMLVFTVFNILRHKDTGKPA
eukprot:IDg19302t1